MRFDFKLIPQADLEARLKYVLDTIEKPYEAEAVSAIARAGAGSVRDMLSIADTCVSYTSGKLTYADVTTVLGGVDFNAVASFCEAVLCGEAGKAFERAEAFLSAGKSVGVLVKDVMNFLNSCAVAKICRDGRSLLALPEESYTEVLRIAKKTDGHALLRATEIFAEAEQTLKYSVAPRVLFETAVLKASMPAEDYNIEALLGRIATLEKRLDEGVFVKNEGGMVETNAPAPVKTESVQEAEAVETPVADLDIPPEMDAPPDEAETGGNVYFDAGYIPEKKKETPVAPSAPLAPRVVKPAVSGDAKVTFGSFLRTLRKMGKSGVLFTICMDLDSAYEDGKFVLLTQSDTIYRSLTKPEHYAILKDAFAAIGLEEGQFEVRRQGKKTDEFEKGLNEIKATFGGVKIDIK